MSKKYIFWHKIYENIKYTRTKTTRTCKICWRTWRNVSFCVSRFVYLWSKKKNMLTSNENVFLFVHSRCECDWLPLFLGRDIDEVSASIETRTNVCEKIYRKNVHCKFTQNTQKMLSICVKKNIYFNTKNIWKHKMHNEKKQQEYVKHVEKHKVRFFSCFLCIQRLYQ